MQCFDGGFGVCQEIPACEGLPDLNLLKLGTFLCNDYGHANCIAPSASAQTRTPIAGIFTTSVARTFAGDGFHSEGIMNNPIEQSIVDATARSADQPRILDASGHEMQGQDQGHKVSAIYPSVEEAEGVRHLLIERGFDPHAITLLESRPEHPLGEDAAEEGSDEVLKEVLVDGAIGTAVGTGVGAIGTVALVAANITLFVASPVIGPLAMLGWFAGLGGVVGAAVGAGGTPAKDGKFSDAVKDAIEAGNAVLVVRTLGRDETARAKEIVLESLHGRDPSAMESN